MLLAEESMTQLRKMPQSIGKKRNLAESRLRKMGYSEHHADGKLVQRALLMFEITDFYDAFGLDADVIARLCDLSVTTRHNPDSTTTTMCGFPVARFDEMSARLFAAGYKVAIWTRHNKLQVYGEKK